MTKNKPMFSVGDLVELARFGQIPERSEDRVYGVVIESVDSSEGSYHVPRYRVKLIGSKKNDSAPFGSRFESDASIATVLEYDLVGPKDGEASQE